MLIINYQLSIINYQLFDRMNSERNTDLFNVFEQVRKENRPGESITALSHLAVHRPAQSFYLSALTLRRIAKGRRRPARALKSHMQADILLLYERYRREHPDMSERQIAELLECAPAPRFYLAPSSAASIIYRKLGKRDKR
jgi:hypothetical protein